MNGHRSPKGRVPVRKSFLQRLLFLLFLLLLPHQGRAATYLFTDLGDFWPSGINEEGQIVGTLNDQAHLYTDGSLVPVGPNPTYDETGQTTFSSLASGINDAGQVIGTAGGQAFIYDIQRREFSYLGTLPGAESSSATAINNRGEVVGSSGGEIFLYDGSMTAIDFGMRPQAAAINDSGEVVGSGEVTIMTKDGFELIQRRALLYDGTLHDLGVLEDDLSVESVARDINTAGQVVGGTGTAPDISYQVFLYEDGAMQNLGIPGVGSAINDHGQIVGRRILGHDQYQGFLYDLSSGELVDLHPELPAEWLFSDAIDINDQGVIIGRGTLQGSTSWETRGFLLTPLSEEDEDPIEPPPAEPPPTGSPPPEPLLGDADGDGSVTVNDAREILKRALGKISPDLDRCDVAPVVDGDSHPDGRVTVGDAVVVLRQALGLIEIAGGE